MNQRVWRCELEEGAILLEIPAAINKAEVADLREWFDLVLRTISRSADARSAKSGMQSNAIVDPRMQMGEL